MNTSFEISLDTIEPTELALLVKMGFDLGRFSSKLQKLENVFVSHIFKFTQLKSESIESIEVSLQIVSADEIAKINNEFRDKNKETDVISLSMYEDLRDSAEEVIGPFLSLGDIIICSGVACQQASESKLHIETELIELLIHGLLHLCGFDHEISEDEKEKMYRWERKIFELVEGDSHE